MISPSKPLAIFIMSTKPKSVLEAEANRRDGSGGSSSQPSADRNGSTERFREIREFVNKYKQLPDDFLRVPPSYYQMQPQQSDLGPQTAGGVFLPNQPAAAGQLVDMIDISVVEAQLVKNYGLLRMDCYCKIRVGHMVCETSTSANCAKNPKWDGVYQFALKPGIDSFHIEIYDEKQFSLDEKIAWLHEPIPPEIFQGITIERWFPLSGKLGKDKEGSILLVLSHKTKMVSRSVMGHPHHQEIFLPPGAPTSQMIPGAAMLPVDPNIQIPAYIQPPPTPTRGTGQPAGQTAQVTERPHQRRQQQPTERSVQPASESDISQLAEMFPSIDRNIIKTILENNNHDKDAAISTLLAMA